jgi:hypothetical protein
MNFNDFREGNIYNCPFSSQTLTTVGNWDLFLVKTSSGSRVQILDLQLGQQSTNNATVQSLGVAFIVGTTSTGAGTAITPVNTKRWSGTPTAVSSVSGPSSSLASTTSVGAAMVYANAFEANSGKFSYRVNEDFGVPVVITNSQTMVIRVTTPQSSGGIVIHGTLTFKEVGMGLPS